MNKKIIIRYVLLCLPFVSGSILFSYGVFNIISSLLFFAGGYVAIKNLCDYRKIKKNFRLSVVNSDKKIDMNTDEINIDDGNSFEKIIDNSMDINTDDQIISKNKYCYKYKGYESIPGFKSTRRYIRVRRRY